MARKKTYNYVYESLRFTLDTETKTLLTSDNFKQTHEHKLADYLRNAISDLKLENRAFKQYALGYIGFGMHRAYDDEYQTDNPLESNSFTFNIDKELELVVREKFKTDANLQKQYVSLSDYLRCVCYYYAYFEQVSTSQADLVSMWTQSKGK